MTCFWNVDRNCSGHRSVEMQVSKQSSFGCRQIHEMSVCKLNCISQNRMTISRNRSYYMHDIVWDPCQFLLHLCIYPKFQSKCHLKGGPFWYVGAYQIWSGKCGTFPCGREFERRFHGQILSSPSWPIIYSVHCGSETPTAQSCSQCKLDMEPRTVWIPSSA